MRVFKGLLTSNWALGFPKYTTGFQSHTLWFSLFLVVARRSSCISGHLDSWDLGTSATDDGAGIAIAFSAGRLIAAFPQRPSRTIRVVLFGAEETDFSGAAYAKAHEEETGKIVIAGEADFGSRTVYSVQLPAGAAPSDFGRTLQRIVAPLGANVDRRPALGGGEDIGELQNAGVPVAGD